MLLDIREKIRNTTLRKTCGFTLVEVMVSLGILSFGVLAVASMQNAALLGSVKSNSVTQATTIGMDRMERLMGLPFATWTTVPDGGNDTDLSTYFSSLPAVPTNIESVEWFIEQGPSPIQDTTRIIRVEVKSREMNSKVILRSLKTNI
ncbi:prepilin-type N-terminal cleavage/methylation domain-containing protein [Thermodesulfobacteriota bacterium]